VRVAATAAGSVRDALGAAADAIAAAGSESARLDAELLLEAATGWDRHRFTAEPEAGVPAEAGRRFGQMVRRRLRCEPVAYILGRKGFRGIELEIDPRALVPRPETELLVELALELEPRTVLDVGTGSGAVALAIADELPEAEVVATDTSAGALELARDNAERLGLSDRVRFEPGTLPVGRFDLLLANMPYVSESEWEGLAPEIRRFEPREALVAGPTGLEAIESLLEEISEPPAAIGLEVGAGQAGRVSELVAEAGYREVDARADLAGIERVVIGRGAG
jgi:release factor glutamine methyltransferase